VFFGLISAVLSLVNLIADRKNASFGWYGAAFGAATLALAFYIGRSWFCDMYNKPMPK
jgi:hypothetical protein